VIYQTPGTPEQMMGVTCEPFGTSVDSQNHERLTITNANGLSCSFITLGATIASVRAPDREGNFDQVALGFDTLEDYLNDVEFIGPTVGRFANRIGGAAFTLDGQRYELPANEPPNHLHGGDEGFNRKYWTPTIDSQQAVTFRYESPDGEAGYPGNVSAAVSYELTDDNEMKMSYRATTDAPTLVNMTNHGYWNLAGAGHGDVLNHMVQIEADEFLEMDEGIIPTGKLLAVADSPLDFRLPRAVGERLKDAPLAKRWQRGYDHCLVLRPRQSLALAATIHDPSTGRVMEVFTTQPAAMFYTGNDLAGQKGFAGRTYQQYGGLCLEAQRHPDAINHPSFTNTILRPGEVYQEQTVHRFGVR